MTTSIYLFCSDLSLSALWKQGIEKKYEVIDITELPIAYKEDNIFILDTENLAKNAQLLAQLKQLTARFLIIGTHWPEEQQVHTLIQGASGYCEGDVPEIIMQQAIATIANGGIWVQRHLIQQVIGSLVSLNEEKKQKEIHTKNCLATLSIRELEVAQKLLLVQTIRK